MKRVIYSEFSDSIQGSTSPILTAAERQAILDDIDSITSDSIITVSEKVKTFLPTVTELDQLSTRLISKAATLSISSTALSTAKTNFVDYLNGLSPVYTSLVADTPVNRTTLNNLLSGYTDQIAVLQTNIQGQVGPQGIQGNTGLTWTPILSANMTRTVNGFKKTGGAVSWGESVRSADSWAQARISATTVATNGRIMLGLSTDPAVSDSNTDINYGFYLTAGGDLFKVVGGSGSSTGTTYIVGDVITISHENTDIVLYKNGTEIYRWINVVLSTDKFFLDSSFFDINTELLNITVTQGGATGYNTAQVVLYKRSATTPALPTTTTTYTFATGSATGQNNGWTISAPTSDGNPLWSTQASAFSQSATDPIASTEWVTPVKLVSDGQNAEDPVEIQLTQPTLVIPTDDSGLNPDLSNTGTVIKVYQGAVDIQYDGVGTANGTWKVTAVGVNCIPGSITDTGATATIANLSGITGGLTPNSGTITYTIVGKTAGGRAFTLVKVQSFQKLVGAIADFTPPTIPTGLALTSTLSTNTDGSQVAVLKADWTANAESDLNGYILAVREGTGGFVEFTLGSTSTHWEQPVKLNTLYGAKIKSFDKRANKSGFSTEVTHTTTKDTVGPATPTGLLATPAFQSIFLEWLNPSDTDLAEILIQENTVASATGAVQIATVKATPGQKGSYTRTGLATGQQRFYRIIARDTSGNGSGYTSFVNATTLKTVTADIENGVLTAGMFGSGIRPTFQLANTTNTAGFVEGDVGTYLGELYRFTGGGWVKSVKTIDLTGTISSTQIADASINIAKFASTLTPIEIVAALPTTGNYAGRTVFLTTDNKLYRHTGSPTGSAGFTAATPAADISGTLADAQIAGLAASKITGQLTDAQIAAIAATKLTGQITSTQITDNSITTAKIAANAVTATQIAANTITAANIAAGTITATEIASGAITTAKLTAGAVTANEIAAGAIITSKLAAGAVTANELAANSVIAGKIAAGAITATEIAAGTITAKELLLTDRSNMLWDTEFADSGTASTTFWTSTTWTKDTSVESTNIGTATPPGLSVRAGFKSRVGDGTLTQGAGSLTAGNASATSTGRILAESGRTYRFSGKLFVKAGSTCYLRVRFRFYNQAGSTLTTSGVATIVDYRTSAAPADVVIRLETISSIVAPADTYSVSLLIEDLWSTTLPNAGYMILGAPRLNMAADATLIVDGAISANKIQAQSITAGKLSLGDFSNMVPDGSITDAGAWSGQSFTLVPLAGLISRNYIQIPNNGPAPQEVRSRPIPVEPSKPYWVYAASWVSSAGNAQADVIVDFHDSETNAIAGIALTSFLLRSGTTSATTIGIRDSSAQFTSGATARYMTVRFTRSNIGTGTASARFADPIVRRAQTGELIVDGAITANKILANTITAAQIATGSLTTATLAAGAITAEKMTLTASNLALNGDFSNGLSDWTMWNLGFMSLTTNSVSTSPAKNALRFTHPGSGTQNSSIFNGSPVYNQPGAEKSGFQVEPGKVYRVALDTIADTAGVAFVGTLQIIPYFLKGDGTIVSAGTILAVNRSGLNSTWSTLSGEFTAPSSTVRCFIYIQVYNWTAGNIDITNLRCNLKASADLIVDGAITTNKMSANSINGDRISAGTLAADRIVAGSISGTQISTTAALPGTVTVGSTGVTIGTIQTQANDPAARVNANSTTIDPGKILISGATTLASWRNGTDATKIEGGSIAANTVTANKMTIGNRGIVIDGINFEANRSVVGGSVVANNIAWTAGAINYTDDAGVTQRVAISASVATWSSGVLYIYWVKGANALSATSTVATANGSENVILATYKGGTDIVVTYGQTIIDGSKITTGTIDADRIKAGSVLTNTLVVGSGGPTLDALTNVNKDGQITRPGGGYLASTNNAQTGSIKIRLPQSWTNTMMKFNVDIYEYQTNLSCTLEIAGYTAAANTSWMNVSAKVVSGNVEYPVYFGHDGTYACIYIGITTEVWTYPQIQVRDWMGGYQNYSRSMWESNWQVSFVSTQQNVTNSVLDTLPGADWNKVSGTGKPANNATVGAPVGTNVGSVPAANVAGWAYSTDSTFIDGGDIYTGSVTAAKITATSLSAISANLGTITAGVLKDSTSSTKLDLSQGYIHFKRSGFMKVSGSGFGTSNQFLEWYGPERANLADCNETDAIYYIRNDGKFYAKGTFLSADTVYSANGSSSATISFTATGNLRKISFSYNASAQFDYVTDTDGSTSETHVSNATVVLEKSTNGGSSWTTIQTYNLTGSESTTCEYSTEIPLPNRWECSKNAVVASTGVNNDSSGGTGAMQIRVRRTALTLSGAGSPSYEACNIVIQEIN